MITTKLNLDCRVPPRRAFSLIELLVVIAIIIVLVGLIIVAVPKALDPANEAMIRTDITQLSAALQAFQTKYQVSYVPSRIILCKNYLKYFQDGDPRNGIVQIVPGVPSQLHADSLDYLQRIFPRITTPPAGQALPLWVTTGIDWNGNNQMQDPLMGPKGISVNGAPETPFLGFSLEGEQCLVFFLGGIPQDNGDGTFTATGFSTNPLNPAQAGGDRTPPFFEFKSNRLKHWTPPGQLGQYVGTAPGFPSYLDGFGQTPYAYFSSYRTSEGQSNGYNRYVNYSNPYIRLKPAQTNCGPVSTDCQALPFAKGDIDPDHLGVWPYAQSMGPGVATAYLNPRTFQIISAGKDVYFGQGTLICNYPGAGTPYWSGAPLWSPQNATNIYPLGQLGGADDIANFYDRQLGVPTQ